METLVDILGIWIGCSLLVGAVLSAHGRRKPELRLKRVPVPPRSIRFRG
jgi:hypothetical protein